MKKIIIALFALFLMSTNANATHYAGGEISWTCLQNGKFVFFMVIYKSCAQGAAGISFSNKSITIAGGSLPRNASNQIISSIIVKPDSNRWANASNGDINPSCNGTPISCANGDPGATQAFWFQSDPIQLKGTPPAAGWQFRFGAPCCRATSITNLQSNAFGIGYRATMFRIRNPAGSGFLTTDQCDDASPQFIEVPAVQICRGYKLSLIHI